MNMIEATNSISIYKLKIQGEKEALALKSRGESLLDLGLNSGTSDMKSTKCSL